MTEIQATLFKRPGGNKEIISLKNIRENDANYINDNNVIVSLEDIGCDFVIYFDDGSLLDNEDTPDEIIVFSRGRNCEDCMAEGVELIKQRKKAETP